MAAPDARLETRSSLDPQHPFPGLKSFTEFDATYFHGRQKEQAELFRMVKRQVLTTCFGASGLGKTSLLNAGVFPLLRQAQFFPVAIRLNFAKSAGGYAAQIKQRFREEATLRQVEVPDPEPAETLWEYFHRVHFWDPANRLLTPVIVLDQFEEIFTLGAGDERGPQFRTELADLVENRIPAAIRDRFVNSDDPPPFSLDRQNYRVLLSLREDFLPHLEDAKAAIPSLTQNRFRLTAMNGQQAMEAILEPGKEVVTREVALEIVRIVCGPAAAKFANLEESLDALRVEPTLLSLFCHELNLRRTKANRSSITSDLLEGAGDQIVTAFYERVLGDRKPQVREFIEERLLTGSGFRRAEAVEEAVRLPGVTEQDIRELVDRRLLRTEERLGIPHVELTHDVLAGVVTQSRNRRRIEEEKARQQALLLKRARIAAVVVIVGFVLLGWVAKRARDDAFQSRAQAQQATDNEQKLKVLAAQQAELVAARRQAIERYQELTAELAKRASPTELKVIDQLKADTDKDACDLCGYDAAGWRKQFLRPIAYGTWHVIVRSEPDGVSREQTERDRGSLQKRFPRLAFDIMDSISPTGGNARFAIVVASGLDARTADRVLNYIRDLGVEKSAYKMQQKL